MSRGRKKAVCAVNFSRQRFDNSIRRTLSLFETIELLARRIRGQSLLGDNNLKAGEWFMSLSPNDIRNYEFPSQMRGYDKDEVDSLLEQVACSLETLKQDNLKLSMEVDSLKSQLSGLRSFEDTIKSAAIDARRNADQTIADAKNEATEILSKAKEEAERLVSTQEVRIEEIKSQVVSLELTRKSFIGKVRDLIRDHSELIDRVSEEDARKEMSEAGLEVTESEDMTRDRQESIVSEHEGMVSESVEMEEANAADDIIAVASVETDKMDETEEPGPVDPELVAALENYKKHTEQQASESDTGKINVMPPPQGVMVETTARAEDIPDGFIAADGIKTAATEESTGTDKVKIDGEPERVITPEDLSEELDSVVAKFEEEMDKAQQTQ